jgi:tetratricopeptide (TPR) repeat protein
VYGKTLSELESDWLIYLRNRTFSAAELYLHALRASGYRDYTTYYDLLMESAQVADSVPARIHKELGLGAAQLGRWDECAKHLQDLVDLSPADMSARDLLAEALWARGDTTGAEYQARVVLRTDPSDPQAYLLMGDLQMARRRVDSAMTLWQAGLRRAPDIASSQFELSMRIGRLLREHHKVDSANGMFQSALTSARVLLSGTPQDPLALSRVGEALAECDSLAEGLGYLQIAAYAADAPQDLARIALANGRLHDLAGERAQAVEAYEYVLDMPAPRYYSEAARHYLNAVYGRR